jgi:hypothetical protein
VAKVVRMMPEKAMQSQKLIFGAVQGENRINHKMAAPATPIHTFLPTIILK